MSNIWATIDQLKNEIENYSISDATALEQFRIQFLGSKNVLKDLFVKYHILFQISLGEGSFWCKNTFISHENRNPINIYFKQVARALLSPVQSSDVWY